MRSPSWERVLAEECSKPYLSQLAEFLKQERQLNAPIYPPKDLVFSAFQHTPFEKVKVVIIGQDPYHGPGQAHGLSFSVPQGVTPPPSLKNIFKELKTDLGLPIPAHGCLIPWADQGVLLLNATLTVAAGKPQSHAGRGWELFTDAVVRQLLARQTPLVFLLWGRAAQEKLRHLYPNNPESWRCPNANSPGCLGIQASPDAVARHRVLTAAHPSPFSADGGFFGCRHFSQANAFLKAQGLAEIDWRI